MLALREIAAKNPMVGAGLKPALLCFVTAPRKTTGVAAYSLAVSRRANYSHERWKFCPSQNRVVSATGGISMPRACSPA